MKIVDKTGRKGPNIETQVMGEIHPGEHVREKYITVYEIQLETLKISSDESK